MSVLYDGIVADLEKFHVPGASWATIDRGEIAEAGCAGVTQVGVPAPVVPGTLFQACSISKPVAVFTMLRLVDRGLLDLDEDVNRRLTSWQVPPTGDWQPVVSLRQLASHSAGLTVHGFPGYRQGVTLPTTVQVLDGTAPTNTFGVRVDIVPGTQFRYAGGGTVVLQQLLEDVTGTPFQQLARELVLEPVGMADSDYAQPLPAALHSRAATAHDELGEPVPGRWHSYPELAAAGLWTTPTDLAKFAIAVQQTYAGADGALLSPGLSRELLTPQIAVGERTGGLDHVGLGLFLGDGGARFGHSGGNEGYRCHLLAYRDTGQGAAVMTNSDNGGWVVQRAFAAIARTYGWNDYPVEIGEPDLPTEETMAAVVGAYTLDGRIRMDVARRGGGLAVVFGAQPPLRFTAASATRFATENADAELQVREDGRLVFIQGGKELDCARE